jgi:Fe2+ or Zn2+ uptake regulation protein
MNEFTISVSETARLKILQLLRKSGVAINHETLQIALESMSIRLSLHQIKAEMQFLADVGCVTSMQVAHLFVIEISDKGNDVAKGISRIPGIAPFVPGSGL